MFSDSFSVVASTLTNVQGPDVPLFTPFYQYRGPRLPVLAFAESRVVNVLVAAYTQNVEAPFLYQRGVFRSAFQQNPTNNV